MAMQAIIRYGSPEAAIAAISKGDPMWLDSTRKRQIKELEKIKAEHDRQREQGS